MIDIAGWLRETQRQVGSREIEAGSARTAVMRHNYEFPIEDVWDACTDPERLSRWFLPVSGDLRPGGSFQLEGNARGEIRRCEPPRLLAVTWAYGDRAVDEVELRLKPAADGAATVLELEHATVTREVEWEGRKMDVIPGVGSGWEPGLAALELYLRGELPDKPGVEWIAEAPAEFREAIDQLSERVAEEWTRLVEAARAP